MVSKEELRKRLLATFKEEAAEHLHVLTVELDAVVTAPQAAGSLQRLETLFRVMHTLKGASRSVQLAAIERICQDCEVELRAVTRGEAPITQSFIERLVDATDKLRGLIESGNDMAPPAETPPAPVPEKKVAPRPDGNGADTRDIRPSAEPPRAAPVQPGASTLENGTAPRELEVPQAAITGTVRVDIGRLDRLLLAAEDLLLPSLAAGERVKAARQMTQDLAQLRTNFRVASRSRNGGMNGHQPSAEILTAVRELEGRSRHLAASLADDQRALRAAVGDLFQETRHARMIPAASMLAAFPTMVRDLCRTTGKEAAWSLHDTGLDLDRKVIETIKAPLIHLVRNAIDHGIERPDERLAVGKPRRGRVAVSILPADGGRIAIEIEDDGRGMDLAALRDAAVRSRAASATQVKAMSDDDVIDIAFRPGVSTSAVITSISGLGLGLAIAREQIERIDGHVGVRSVPGQGTTFRLEIPATVASYRGLLVSAQGARLLWPAESVIRAIGVPRAALGAALQSGIMVHDGDTLPFGRLGSIMGIPVSDQSRSDRALAPCILAGSAQRRAIFAVDEILGETEVLIKDFPSPLRRVRNVSSVGLLATGELALVLRPSDLLTSVQVAPGEEEDLPAHGATRAMRVLVVDDSITTRTMERNLLEAAGYDVSTAADGLDAWSMLQAEDIDLVVSDVDMPRMNGFDLTSRIRGDSRLSELPIVLVTALESRDDKERGIKIGANAYVLKSSFEQSNLLEIVGRLI
jgi:two-component system chemotaxis sensor kinase CheA